VTAAMDVGLHYTYDKKSVIGQGSFAKVYKGWSKQRNIVVAVKKIKKKKWTHNIQSEINILKELSHTHVVQLFDQEVDKAGDVYLFFEYCDGGDLHQYIRARKVLRETEAADFMMQLSSGLEYLHSRNLTHRDLKPQNLLLFSKQHPIVLKIADFGFARYLPEADLAETLCGTPLYMAPEILARKSYNSKVDLWSAGAILYQMVVGKPPYTGQNPQDLLMKIEQNKINIPVSGCNISPECQQLLGILLKKNPTFRCSFEDLFQSAFLRKAQAQAAARAQAQSRQNMPASRTPSPGNSAYTPSHPQASISAHRSPRLSPSSPLLQGTSPPNFSMLETKVMGRGDVGNAFNQGVGAPPPLSLADGGTVGQQTTPPLPPRNSGGIRRATPPPQTYNESPPQITLTPGHRLSVTGTNMVHLHQRYGESPKPKVMEAPSLPPRDQFRLSASPPPPQQRESPFSDSRASPQFGQLSAQPVSGSVAQVERKLSVHIYRAKSSLVVASLADSLTTAQQDEISLSNAVALYLKALENIYLIIKDMREDGWGDGGHAPQCSTSNGASGTDYPSPALVGLSAGGHSPPDLLVLRQKAGNLLRCLYKDYDSCLQRASRCCTHIKSTSLHGCARAENLLFTHALRIGEEAAKHELLGQKEAARNMYENAKMLLEVLQDDFESKQPEELTSKATDVREIQIMGATCAADHVESHEYVQVSNFMMVFAARLRCLQ